MHTDLSTGVQHVSVYRSAEGRGGTCRHRGEGSALRRGDVVLYRRENGMLVLHRIYKIGQDGLYLLGDHQTAIEGPVRREQVKGKMTGMVRDGRYMDVGNPGYRMLSVVWLWLRPARRVIMVPAARLRRMVRFALFRRNNKRYNK
ncbi:MAG: hypothetical protein ACLR7N_09060 [Roseburia hominis]